MLDIILWTLVLLLLGIAFIIIASLKFTWTRNKWIELNSKLEKFKKYKKYLNWLLHFLNITLGFIFYIYFTNSSFYPQVLRFEIYLVTLSLFWFWFIYNFINIIFNWKKIIHLWFKSSLNKLFILIFIGMLFYLFFKHIYVLTKWNPKIINFLFNYWFLIYISVITVTLWLAIIVFKKIPKHYTFLYRFGWQLLITILTIILCLSYLQFFVSIFGKFYEQKEFTNWCSKVKCLEYLIPNSSKFDNWFKNIQLYYIEKLSFHYFLDWKNIPILIIWLKFFHMSLELKKLNLGKNEKLKKIFNDDEVKIFNDKIFYSVVSPKASGKTYLMSKYKNEIRQISVSEIFQGTSGAKSLSELFEEKIRGLSFIDSFALKLFSLDGVIKSKDNFKYLENEIIIIEDVERLINDYDIIENSVKYHRCEEFFAYLKRIEDYFINNDNKPIIILTSAKDIWSHIKE